MHFWCKMTPDRSHSDTVGRVANKPPSTLTSTFRNIALLTHFPRQRFFIIFFILKLGLHQQPLGPITGGDVQVL